MWPVEGGSAAAPPGWSDLDTRARRGVVVGGVALVAVLALGTVLAVRASQSQAPVYGQTVGSAALWTGGSSPFAKARPVGGGPSSNHTDMAFDPARGVLVAWDHGCDRLVMGFQGGCTGRADLTWTWDGQGWTPHPGSGQPAGAGAMAYDVRIGRVAYANGAGQEWTWDGTLWRSLPTSPPAALAHTPSLAVGFDGTGRLVIVNLAATWAWDGTTWTKLGGGFDYLDARSNSEQLVADPGRGQLVYPGKQFTWTWAGASWQRHPQPAFASAAAVFDPASGGIVLLSEDTQACDSHACRTTRWLWNGAMWSRLGDGPPLPLSRSEAFPPALAYDSQGARLDVFVSAS